MRKGCDGKMENNGENSGPIDRLRRPVATPTGCAKIKIKLIVFFYFQYYSEGLVNAM